MGVVLRPTRGFLQLLDIVRLRQHVPWLLPEQSIVNRDNYADGVNVQHCVFSPAQVCTRCGTVTRFPDSLRVCSVQDDAPAPASQHDAVSENQRFGFGPGSELKSLLSKIGITASPDCKCTKRAYYMDQMESEQPGWCEANIDEIVGWLRESAAERGLPFLDVAGRVLVRRAIANARRKEAALAEGSPHHDRREEVAPPSDAPQG